ncbi:MerR family transcriptional regulator [Sphingomonas sp. AOB5]|uniref:MerR family transcriptional regulator n=1 Tax=Sphingomonas sp. AOB5 TaxID=3034017 RepID=UPI0023F8FF83|nr:MerR family transcriptional regulator [Sphingomonas sp. AOB5]MDF7776976.1 MerR family transcriptional regulator [Sphingomonas sp. AOB5]
MEQVLDIGEVARRTGLTLRGLRFYEARGLVKPLRTEGGRRIYGAGELARLNAVVALKRAGFSLAQIAGLLGDRRIDLGRLVAAQIAALDARQAEIAEARALLQTVQSRIDHGEPVDVATLCSLIKSGDMMMEHENWKAVSDRYLSDEAKADFAANPPPSGFDQADYSAKWADLTGRIEAALPMDPASAEARAFYDEWQALLAPFRAVATPAMMQGVSGMYDRIGEWKGEQKPPFSPEVWDFIKSVGSAA